MDEEKEERTVLEIRDGEVWAELDETGELTWDSLLAFSELE